MSSSSRSWFYLVLFTASFSLLTSLLEEVKANDSDSELAGEDPAPSESPLRYRDSGDSLQKYWAN